METVAKRYAEALFELATEERSIEAYQKDMQTVESVFQDPEIIHFFSHVALNDEVKVHVLNTSLKGQVCPYVFSFVLLLIQKRRIRYIMDICRQFQLLCYEHLGIKLGKVFTAYALSDEQMHKIENAMSLKIKKKVQLKMIVDPSLIGGVKVEIDSHVYDGSLSYKLESLRQELLRK